MSLDAELRIPDMTTNELDELIKQFPSLKPFIRAEPSSNDRDQEAGLLTVILTLAPPVLTLGAAVLNFIAARTKPK